VLVKNPISLISNTRLSIGSTVEDVKEYLNAIPSIISQSKIWMDNYSQQLGYHFRKRLG